MSEKYARKKRDEAKELARNQDIEELAEEALTEGADAEGLPDGKPEPTFEQKVFEKMREISADFAKNADWEQLWVDYEDSANDERARAWTFICYPESMNPNMLRILSEHGMQGCISPLHDSDRWPDGTLKKEHFHVVLYFPGKKSRSQVKTLVDALGGVMLQLVHNIVGLVRYFAHMDIQPDKVATDKGKVHYSPDDIVSFGGFDAQAYLKATQTQISKALGELYKIVRDEDITAYSTLVDRIYTDMVDYMFVMSNAHVCSQLSMYIRSRYALAHRNDELKALRTSVDIQKMQINELIGGVARMEQVVDRMAHLITGEGDAVSDTEDIAQDDCDDSTEQEKED